MQSRIPTHRISVPALLFLSAWWFAACAPHRTPEPERPGDVLISGARHPAVHPDNRVLAVQAILPGRPFRGELFLFEGSQPHRLTTDQQFDGHPAWHPDGSLLAYSSGPEQQPEIRLMEPETGSSRVLISRSAFQPSFSPDGAHLAFTRLTPRGSSIHQIHLADSAVEQLVPDDGAHHSPAHHPGGRLLFYVRGMGAETDLWAVDRLTQKRAPVLASEYREQYPVLSPDGRWMVMASDRPLPDGSRLSGNSLWLVDMQENQARVVMPVAVPESGYSYGESDFYPSGRRLAAARQTPDGRWEIARVDLDLPEKPR